MSSKPENIRPEKLAMVEEIRANVDGAPFVFMTDFTGLDMAETTELRSRLRKAGGRFRVVRNRLLRQAASEAALAGLARDLTGATAVITGDGDVAEVAKTLNQFLKEHERPIIKGGVFEGQALDSAEVRAIGDLPPKPVLQSMLLGVLTAPMTQLAGVLKQKVSTLVYVLKAVEEKKQGAAAASAEA